MPDRTDPISPSSGPLWERPQPHAAARSVIHSGTDEFFDTMSAFSRLLLSDYCDPRDTLTAAERVYFNISFHEKEDLPVSKAQELLGKCPFLIPVSALQPSLGALAYRTADYVPREAFTRALQEAASGELFERNEAFWKGLKYARRTFKAAVYAWRTFDVDHTGGDLGTVNRAVGKLNDIARYGGPAEKVMRYAAVAGKNWVGLGDYRFGSFITPDSSVNIKDHLLSQLNFIRDVASSASPDLPVIEIHRCRKSLYYFLNLFRLISSVTAGVNTIEDCPEYRALTILSNHLGYTHEPYIELKLRGEIIDYPGAREIMRPDLKEALEFMCSKIRFPE